MSHAAHRFILVGPYAGSTMPVNGHPFEDGEFTFVGTAEQAGYLTNVFENYSAYPAHVAPEKQAEYDALVAGLPAKVEAPVEPVAPLGAADQVDANAANQTHPTLGEAIGQLDAENDDHWTTSNLPSIDALEALTNSKVTRAAVEAVAEGFTRAKARALRGALS